MIPLADSSPKTGFIQTMREGFAEGAFCITFIILTYLLNNVTLFILQEEQSMHTFAVTVKGQVVIPSDLRRRHHIGKGTKVCFLEKGQDIILRPVTPDAIDAMRGSLKTHGKALKALREEKKKEKNK